MDKKIKLTLGAKVVIMILTMSVILCATALFVSYQNYRSRMISFYEQVGRSMCLTLASQMEPEELDYYYETQTLDDRYYEIQRFILDLVASNNVEYLYVVRPHGIGVTFLFDSDMTVGENMDYSSGGYCAMGTYVDLAGDFAANLESFLAGQEVEPITQVDPDYGWMMTVCTPVLHDDGTMAAYVMVDISVEAMMDEQRTFLLTTGALLAALSLVFAIIYLVLARRSIIQPVRQLTAAAQSYEGGNDTQAFDRLKITGSQELRGLAEAFRMMLAEIRTNNQEQQELLMREQKLAGDMGLASDLNAAMLPKGLPKREEGYPFEVRGRSQQGQEMTSCFYDYFLLDQDQLCVIVGETPGSGVPQALYTVMAKATIKSHITSGLSLSDTMSATNQQMYEMGSELYMRTLVGILNGTTGHFSCVNAGQRDPLIMRSQDRYEWLDSFSFAPLGQNENVLYRTMDVDLRQGDRLFFHTDGLDEIRGKDGRSFGEEQMRLTLNQRKVREAGIIQQLEQVSDAGGVYAAQSSQIRGYAILGLEFIRRDRAQAHCVVEPGTAGTAALQQFLRAQMEANGLTGREMSQFMVLSDELFSLCRRNTDEDARFMVECTVSTEERLVVLRINGSMKGQDPMAHPEGDPAYYAVSFIRQNTEQVSFTHEEFKDTVMLVKRLGQSREFRAG